MRFAIWIVIFFCSLTLVDYSFGGTLSSYTSVATLQSGDKFPVIVIQTDVNGNVNWQSIKSLLASQLTGLNWQSIQGTSVSAINWTGLYLNSNTGINWNMIRNSYGNTSASTNWQVFGV